MKELYLARDRVEAQLLVDFLDRKLIEAVILGDYLAGAAGELPAGIFPAVWVVEDEDLPRAREALAVFLQPDPAQSAGPWICPACGERVEAGFDLCWNCGRSRD